MSDKRSNDEALMKQRDLFYDIALTSTRPSTVESERSSTGPSPSALRQTSTARKESRESSMFKMPISRNTSAGESSTSSALRKLSENRSAGSSGGAGTGSVTFDERTMKKKPNFHKMSSQSSIICRRRSDSLIRGGSLRHRKVSPIHRRTLSHLSSFVHPRSYTNAQGGENLVHIHDELPEILDEGSDIDIDDNDKGVAAGNHKTDDEDDDSTSSADAPEFYTITLPPGAVLLGSTSGGDPDQDRYSPSPPVSPSLRESYSRKSSAFRSNREIRTILMDFCTRTSSHGIPHIGASRSKLGRLFWTIVFICCAIAFVLHTYHTVSLYVEYSTIIQMKLEFGAAPFPAVTICNLNPYKFSLIKNVSEVRDRKIFKLDVKLHPTVNDSKRTKRQVIYEPWLARCRCQRPRVKECVPATSDWESDFTTCLCYYDVNTGNIWPCYDVTVWTEHRCANCSTTNACPYPPKKADWYKGEKDEACICQGISKFCVRRPKGPFKQWRGPEYDNYYFTTTEPPKPSTEAPKNVVPMNSNTRAIEAQEQLTYILAGMEPDRRRELSYDTEEFIILCSFDGSPCDKLRDFQIHDTPRQGNCYTYNFNTSVNLTNTRAGPLYGLRLLVNVNQSDYLDFIEGAGVRLVVHHQNQYPFPDTFGYSAPVGAISSFGIKLKRLKRLGYPWSKCTDVRKYSKAGYLFDEEYSTEGCFRSHLQNALVRRCQCANPRFPTTRNMTICDFDNETQKFCLQSEEEFVEKCQDDECKCFQPCDEIIYQTTYSAASWPSENFVNNTECSINNRNNLSCFEYFRRHTSFVEVFYEQLNYELLTEVEAYTIFSLLADFGGNIGLWIGFSTITMVEFIELGLELIFHCCQRGTRPIIRQTRSFVTMHRHQRHRKRKISRRLSGFPLPLGDEKPPSDATIDENDNYNAFELESDHQKPLSDDSLRTKGFSKSKSITEETILNALGDMYAEYPQLSTNPRKTPDEDYYDNMMSPEQSPADHTVQGHDNQYERAAVARKHRIKEAAKEPTFPDSEEFKATCRSQGHGSPI